MLSIQPLLKQRRTWLVPLICLAVLIVSPLLMLALRSTIDVTLVISPNPSTGSVFGEVNGTRLEVPKDAGLFTAGNCNYTVVPSDSDNPADSLYWQPAQPGAFSFIGKIGEALQSLRPAPQWQMVPQFDYGSEPQGTYRYQLVGGRLPVRLDLRSTGSESPGCPANLSFVIHPEGRTITWYNLSEDGHTLGEQLDRTFYRPRGLASTEDFITEILIATMAAAFLALIAWAAGMLIALLSPTSQVQASEAVRPARRGFILPNRAYVPALAFFVAATMLAAAASLWMLDAIPHVQDEVGYLFQGKIFALGRSYVPTPPGPEFFTNGFIQMFDGKWFAKYPPGFPLLLVPGLLAGLPWLIDPLCAGISLALIYATGLKLYDRPIATWAALLGLVSPWVIFMSASYMSHASTMMWISLFVYALVCARSPVRSLSDVNASPGPIDSSKIQNPGALWATKIPSSPFRIPHSVFALLSGFALGMAFITRQWTAAGIGVGVAIWALGDIALTSGPERWRKFRTYLLIPVGMIPPILVILYENRQLTGDILRFTQDLVGSYDQPGFGPGHGDAIGHTPALGVYNALVYWRSLGSIFDGWPVPFALAPLILGSVVWIWERDKVRLGHDALLWLGTLGLVGAYFLWWSNTTIFGPRYWYEAMPFLLLIAGRGLDFLGRIASSAFPAAKRFGLRWAVPAAFFAIFTMYTLTQSIPYWSAFFTDYNGIPSEPLRAAESAHLKNALIFVALDPAKPNRDYGKVFPANDPLLRSDLVFARDLGPQKNRSLLPLFPGRQPYYLPLTGPPVPGVGP